MPEGAGTLANLAANGVISLTASQPTTYRTLQVKGRDAAPTNWNELDAVVLRHRAEFVAEVAQVGIDGEGASRTWSGRFVAIGFIPQAIFDQTPGPMAGVSKLL
jgi:hypothetical protein